MHADARRGTIVLPGKTTLALCVGLGLGLLGGTGARAQTTISASTAVGLINAIDTINANPGTSYTLTITQNITLTGAGTLVLSGTNTYSGGTTVTGGLVNFGAASNLGSGMVTLNGGGLQWATGTITDISGQLAAIGSSGGTFDTNGNTVTLATALTGTGGVTLADSNATPGKLLLTAANTYSGGTLVVGNDNALGSGTLAMGAGTTLGFTGGNYVLANNITVSGDPDFSVGSGSTQTLTGIIADGASSGIVAVSGGGTLALTGANTYSGGTTISGTGTTVQANNSNPGTSSSIGIGTLTLDGGTFQANAASLTFSNAVQLTGNGGAIDSNGNQLTMSGGITDANGSSGGTLTLQDSSGGNGVLTLSGTNTYTGITAITTAYVIAGSTTAYSPNSAVQLSFDGTLALGGYNNTIESLADGIGGGGDVQNDGSTVTTLTIAGASNVSTTFSGQIRDGEAAVLALAKDGGSTQILSGSNTYSGGTTVLDGTLAAANANALGFGGVTVNPGGTLNVDGVDIPNTLTLSGSGYGGSGTSGPGALSGTGTAEVDGNITLAGNTLVGVADASDSLTLTGAIDDGGNGYALGKNGAGTLVLSGANTYSGGTMLCGTACGVAGGGGILQVTNSTPGSSSSIGTGLLTLDGGTLQVADGTNLIFSNAVQVTADGGTFDSNGTVLTLSGNIGDAGSSSGGTLSFQSSSGQVVGTTVLGGQNTWSGPTAVVSGNLAAGSTTGFSPNSAFQVSNGATLQLSGFDNTIASLSGGTGSGTAENGSATAATLTISGTSGATIFPGTVQDGAGGGALALVKAGAGTQVLSGGNSYSGGTTVSGGVLGAASATALGSGPATVNPGGTLNVTGVTIGNALTLDGSGAGGAGTNGLGALSGTGTSGVSGGITLAGNTLVGVASSGDEMTLSGVIGDGGNGYALVKNGAGTLLLTGNNTYSGATQIVSGTLAIGPGGAIASQSVIDDGTLAYLHSDSVTYGGAISGSGSLVQNGTGTLMLTGNNSYSGGTTISAGTLEGTTGSLQGNIADNGALVFNQAASGIYGGVLSGSGTLTAAGTGTVILDGASGGFTGSTTVQSGTLEVGDASHTGAVLGGSVTVASGTLMGHGTIGGAVSNGGDVHPGGTIGVLTVAGNYTQSSAGTLTIEITPNVAAGAGVGYDQLAVGGSASLAGTLAVLDDTGTYTVGSRYTILTASGGSSGTFGTVTYDPRFAAYITPEVTYDANDVYLVLDPTPAPANAGPPALFNGGQEVPDMLTAMASAASGVADAVLGDVCSEEAQRQASRGQGCVQRPLAGGYHAEVWLRGIGGLGSLTGGGSRMSLQDSYGGMLLGGGIGRGGFTLGAGGGFVSTMLNFSDGSNATQTAGVGFVYGRYVQGPLWLGATAAYGAGQVDGTRALPGTGLTASGNRSGDFAIVQGRAAYDLMLGALTVEPRATLAYIHAGQSGFAESGGSLLDLTYADTNTDEAVGRLIARAMRSFAVGAWGIAPWAEAGVQETFSGLSRGVVVTDGAFSAGVSGASPAPTAAVLGVGLDAEASQALDLFVRYQGLFSANQTGNAFSAGLSVGF